MQLLQVPGGVGYCYLEPGGLEELAGAHAGWLCVQNFSGPGIGALGVACLALFATKERFGVLSRLC